MQLSTRGRYAVMALIDLSLLQGGDGVKSRAVKLEEIAKRQEISLSYLEQLFSQLRRAGVVKSTRGPGGGYRLAQSAENIPLFDIIAAVNEGTKATRCTGESGCLESGRCNAHDLWSALSDHIESFMRHVNLKMICERSIKLPFDLPTMVQAGGKVNVRIS